MYDKSIHGKILVVPDFLEPVIKDTGAWPLARNIEAMYKTYADKELTPERLEKLHFVQCNGVFYRVERSIFWALFSLKETSTYYED